jgi:hypothetical protein
MGCGFAPCAKSDGDAEKQTLRRGLQYAGECRRQWRQRREVHDAADTTIGGAVISLVGGGRRRLVCVNDRVADDSAWNRGRCRRRGAR